MKISKIKKQLVWGIFLLIFLAILHRFSYQLIIGYNFESWQVTEFLINYRGGFVRRGFLGEIILLNKEIFDFSLYKQVIIISLTMLTLYCSLFFIFFKKLKIPLYLLFSILFLQNIIFNDFWLRKDIMIIISFVILIYLLKKKSIFSYLLYFIIFIIAISIHESIFFITTPIICLIYWGEISYKNTFLTKQNLLFFVSIILSILYFLLILISFNGNRHNSEEIWKSLKIVTPNLSSQPQSAIEALSWSPERGLGLFLHTCTNFNNGIYAPLSWAIIIIIFFILLTNINILSKSNIPIKNDKMVLYTFIQFIAISPLWILGWDYSRWCFYWSSSSLILFYFDPLKNYTFHDNFSKKIESLLLIKISKSNYLILILLLGMPAFSWSLYLYNQSTSLYIMLNEITYFVKLII